MGLPTTEYYGLTTWVDDTVGKMLAALDEKGLADDTIVLFTSDHGDNLGSHGRVQKGNLHEESIRIPLIMRGPGLDQSASVVDRQVVSLVDLAPTFLELAGGQAPAHMHGRSLAPLLRGEDKALSDDGAYIETGGGVSLRTPTHLYHLPWEEDRQTPAKAPQDFYDVSADPYQLNNLADTTEQEPTARELDQRLRAWHERIPWMEG